MSQPSFSRFECGHVDALVSYLYDDLAPAERRAIDAHLVACAACAEEVEGLRATRGVLASWTPPDAELGFRIVQEPPAKVVPIARGRRRPLAATPVWLQAAAAVLMMAAATAIANVQVRYDDTGVTVTTGWRQAAPAAPVQASAAPAAATAPAAAADPAPWRRDLASLEAQIHRELAARPAAAPAANTSQAELLQRVRALLQESEQRQQRELALRLAQVVRDVDSQRRADLVRIERSMAQTQGMTGVEVAQQRQLLNYLVRVSQQK